MGAHQLGRGADLRDRRAEARLRAVRPGRRHLQRLALGPRLRHVPGHWRRGVQHRVRVLRLLGLPNGSAGHVLPRRSSRPHDGAGQVRPAQRRHHRAVRLQSGLVAALLHVLAEERPEGRGQLRVRRPRLQRHRRRHGRPLDPRAPRHRYGFPAGRGLRDGAARQGARRHHRLGLRERAHRGLHAGDHARRRHHRRELPRLSAGRLRQHAKDAGMGDGDLRHAG